MSNLTVNCAEIEKMYPFLHPTHGVSVHPVFHVSLLQKAHSSLSPLRSTSVITVAGESSSTIKRIIDSRIWKGQVWYQVSWTGKDSTEDSWEPAVSVFEPRLEQQFHLLFLLKPWGGGCVKGGGNCQAPPNKCPCRSVSASYCSSFCSSVSTL
mgnify:CR=1 FL=1